jgi:hypothetical protein
MVLNARKSWALVMANKRKHISTKPAKRKNRRRLRHIDPLALAAQQGVQPLGNPKELLADFWPEDETADQFNQAVRQWRREGQRNHV